MRNKKMWKHIATVLLTGCMLMTSLVGCGNTETSNESTQTSQSVVESSVTESSKVEEVVEVEPADLTYWCALGTSLLTNLGEMHMIQEACEKTNVNIEFFHPVGNMEEQLNLKIASGEFEDILETSFANYPGGPSAAIADGIIIDLKPYIDAGYAPNLKKIMDENPAIAKQLTTDSGQIYCFPAIGHEKANVTTGYSFRQDMLNKLGMDVPETIDEWEKVLTAMKEQLGVEKPFACTTVHLFGASSWLAGAFDTYSGYYLRDGKVQYGFMDEGYKEYITTLNRWYEAGLIDQECFGNDTKTLNANMLNDKSGVIFGGIGGVMGTLTNNAAETNPSFKLAGAQFPVTEKGQEPRFMPRSEDCRLTNNPASITTDCENVEAAVRYLDFWYGEEGSLLKNFGVEGETYNMVDGYPTYTDLILKNPDGLSIGEAMGKYARCSTPSVGLIDLRYYEQYYQLQEQVDAMALWNSCSNNAKAVLLPTLTPLSEEAEELAGIEVATKTYVEEELTKFIMGLRDLSEYDSFVETLKTMNIERAIELKQIAYDRYLTR